MGNSNCVPIKIKTFETRVTIVLMAICVKFLICYTLPWLVNVLEQCDVQSSTFSVLIDISNLLVVAHRLVHESISYRHVCNYSATNWLVLSQSYRSRRKAHKKIPEIHNTDAHSGKSNCFSNLQRMRIRNLVTNIDFVALMKEILITANANLCVNGLTKTDGDWFIYYTIILYNVLDQAIHFEMNNDCLDEICTRAATTLKEIILAMCKEVCSIIAFNIQVTSTGCAD
jgi:hypothetical protein